MEYLPNIPKLHNSLRPRESKAIATVSQILQSIEKNIPLEKHNIQPK